MALHKTAHKERQKWEPGLGQWLQMWIDCPGPQLEQAVLPKRGLRWTWATATWQLGEVSGSHGQWSAYGRVWDWRQSEIYAPSVSCACPFFFCLCNSRNSRDWCQGRETVGEACKGDETTVFLTPGLGLQFCSEQILSIGTVARNSVTAAGQVHLVAAR